MNTNEQEHAVGDLFRRDGHLSGLTVDRIVLDDLSAAELVTIGEHLAGCPPCDGRLSQARAEQEEELPPLIAPKPMVAPKPDAKVVPIGSARRAKWAVWGALAAAALLVLVLRPWANSEPGPTPDTADDFRAKGGDIALQVVREGGQGKLLVNGDTVRAGDHVGFAVRLKRDGYVLIMGLDEGDKDYVCYPRPSGPSAAMKANADFERVEDAIRFNSTAGTERIVAFLCNAPLDTKTASAAMRAGTAAQLDGCSLSTTTLTNEGAL